MSTQDIKQTVIRLEEHTGKLIVTAPTGHLTPDIVAGLRENKAELIEYLSRFGGEGVVRCKPADDYVEEHVEPWAAWKARALNRLFKEQGTTGRPGRITAATVVHGALSGARSPIPSLLSYRYTPDKPDNLGVTGCVPTTYDCRVPVSDPTSPDISSEKPDKTLKNGMEGAE